MPDYREKRKRLRNLTVSSMLSALSVIILAVGSMLDVLDLSAAAIASLTVTYVLIEIGGYYPYLVWIVTSTLSLLLLPQKTSALFFALPAGFYPMVKKYAEKCRKIPCVLIKFLTVNLSLGTIFLIGKLFLPALLEGMDSLWFVVLMYVLSVVCFFCYDLALSKLILFYHLRLRDRWGLK